MTSKKSLGLSVNEMKWIVDGLKGRSGAVPTNPSEMFDKLCGVLIELVAKNNEAIERELTRRTAADKDET